MTAALRNRALAVGANPSDTADERFRKRLLIGVALIMLPAGLVWGLLYWIIGERAGGAHAVGVRRRIDDQPRRVRADPKRRLPADGAAASR
jgi:hypothetical protein